MALKVTVETLDDVQEEFRPLYSETEGGFVLQIDGVDNHPEVKNLKKAYTAEKAKRAEAQEKAREALAKLEAKPEPTAKDEAEMIRLREQLEAERDQWKAKATDYESKVYGLTVETQLDAAIRDSGILEPTFVKAAKRLLSDGVKLADGKPVVETDMGPVTLAEHVKRFVAGEGKAFVSPAKGLGTGGQDSGKAKPSGGNLAGSKAERMAALKAQFPDLD